MKNYTIIFALMSLLTLTTVSCGDKNDDSLEGKKAKLESLQGDLDKLTKEISILEKEIGVLDPEKIEDRVTSVKAMPITTQNFSHFVEANGRLEAINNVFVSPQMGGALTSVLVKEGDFVNKGQTIATIDNSVMRNSISEIKIQLETAKTLFERQKALWDQKIGTEIQYIQAKAQVESLEKRLTTMQSQDAMNVVKSPISGYVDEVRMKSGEMAAPGLGIVRIVNFSNLKVVANIPDTYAGTIQKGDIVSIKFPDLNKEINSSLSFVSQTVNQVSRTFTAEAKVPTDRQLKPNLNAVVKIKDQAKAAAIVIPQNLIQRTERGDIVYIAEKDGDKQIARSREVKTGLSYNGEVEILSGLNAGDILITDGYQDLVDGVIVSF